MGVPEIKHLSLSVFLRKKRNPSGVVSVQVIDKSKGKYKVVKTIGSNSEESKIDELCQQGKVWISERLGERDMFKEYEQEQAVLSLIKHIDSVLLNGAQLIVERVFRLVGFDVIKDDILRHLVTARLCQPLSKSATVEYLKSHFDNDIALQKIYRYLDKLHSTQQELIQQISVEHTRKILGGNIGLVFYDVTTLYFETDTNDNFRERGFSKDGKHDQPQVVLGLLVSKDGYPLSYSLFNGSQYEGRTMLPVVVDFVERFHLDDFVVVADSGLMNQTNVSLLEKAGYKYIIGGRIKSENADVKSWILSLAKIDGCFYELGILPKSRLIVGYSEKRAKKDAYNRDKGVLRLKKACKNGVITKDNLNKRGYNKFLDIEKDIQVTLNESKIADDSQLDGLKGYITNTTLDAEEVYNQYKSLWVVERAYRVTKGTLDIRPMFHFTPKRIEAHVCICFVAYKVYKELERILNTNNIPLSVDKVLSIAKTIVTLRVKLDNGGYRNQTMLLTPQHKSISILYDEKFWLGLSN